MELALLTVQSAAAVLCAVGAWLTGGTTPEGRGAGFLYLILGGSLLIAWALAMHAWPLAGLQAVFLIAAIRGLRTNWD